MHALRIKVYVIYYNYLIVKAVTPKISAIIPIERITTSLLVLVVSDTPVALVAFGKPVPPVEIGVLVVIEDTYWSVPVVRCVLIFVVKLFVMLIIIIVSDYLDSSHQQLLHGCLVLYHAQENTEHKDNL